LRIALAGATALGLALPAAAAAAERQATVEGTLDRNLRTEIERAVGEERGPPENRLQARGRARDAADNAMALLRSEGYYAAEIVPDIGEGDQPQPTIRVEPGDRFLFAEPKVEWIATAPDAETQTAARDSLVITPGQPGRAADVVAAEGRAVSILQQRGYADAQAGMREVIVDHADQTVKPTFRFEAGELVRLGRIQLENRGRTNPAWIESQRPWTVGDPYRPQRVAELERLMLDTQAYDSVTVGLAPKSDPDGTRPVIVSLADRAKRSLEVSAGYSTSEGEDFQLRISRFNWFHRADTVTGEIRYGNIRSRLGVDVSLPHWRRRGDILKLTSELFRDTTDAYDQEGGALRADLTRRRSPTSYFTRGLAVIRSDVNDHHTGKVTAYTFAGLLAVAMDHSDNPLDPHRGWKLELRGEPTGITGDNTLAYLRMQVQGSAYLSLQADGATVIAGRARIGSIAGGTIPGVPASNRFYAGGGGSVRGYEYQGVGPKYADTTPIGGLSLFEASAEIRQRLPYRFGVVAFLDAGSVGQAVNPDFNNLRYGAGVGIRYDLGFGPLRADFAVPINRPKGDAAFQVYISIGQSF
jgi:translocation and assembly module TamA